MIEVTWRGGMAFEGVGPTGASVTMDAIPEFGGQGRGPSPVEALVSALAACSGMDVVSVLRKKRQNVESYRIEVEYDREPPEAEWPRPLLAIRVRHFLTGEGLDPAAVARAVELSDEKYCTVAATLRAGVPIETTWSVG